MCARSCAPAARPPSAGGCAASGPSGSYCSRTVTVGRPSPGIASRGIQPVAVASIVGTVEVAKADVFDASFRPQGSDAEHWKRLWLAVAHGASLPPISVYRVGDLHYVREATTASPSPATTATRRSTPRSSS